MKKMFLYDNKEYFINSILLSIYIFFVILVQFVINFRDFLPYILLIILFPIIAVASFFIVNLVSSINIKKQFNNKYNFHIAFFVNFTILFVIGFIIINSRLLLSKQTIFEGDFFDSISDAANNTYSEMRTPLFSFLFAKIPMLLIPNNNFVFSIWYILFRSLILSFIITCLSKNNIIIRLILLLYYTCLPLSIHSELSILKDTPCAIFVLISLFLIYNRNYYVTKCHYLVIDILIGFSLAFSTILRPNAILFSLLLCVILFIIYKLHKIIALRISLLFIIFLFLINFLTSSFLTIYKYGNDTRNIESMCFPLECIINVIHNGKYDYNYSESLNNFVDILTDHGKNKFEHYNEKQGFESVKFNATNTAPDEHILKACGTATYFDFAKWTFEIFVKEPYLTFRQFCNRISGLIFKRYMPNNKYNTPYSRIYYLFANVEIPVLLLLFIIVLLGRNPIVHGMDVNNYLLLIPIFIYIFGTCMIMSMPSIYRYYMPFHMTFPVYIYYNLINKKT